MYKYEKEDEILSFEEDEDFIEEYLPNIRKKLKNEIKKRNLERKSRENIKNENFISNNKNNGDE